MSSLSKQAGIPFRIVVYPMPEQVWNGGANISAYQSRLQEITREIGVPALDLLPVFRMAAADDRTLYIFWDWHPNSEGHYVAARAIKAFITPVVTQGMVNHSIRYYAK